MFCKNDLSLKIQIIKSGYDLLKINKNITIDSSVKIIIEVRFLDTSVLSSCCFDDVL